LNPRFGRQSGTVVLLALCAIALCGCNADDSTAQRSEALTEVGYVTVSPTSVAQMVELPGRVTAFETSEVRPQVAGLIEQRLFTEGAFVRRGQTLYRIDPRLYAATVNEARANLASAQATAEAARIRAERLEPLARIEAVSAQDLTDAQATAREAAAAVAQNRAVLETARVNLGFTTVPAPISGRISRSYATVGALATFNQEQPLAIIQRLDPIFVDMQQSSADLIALRRALATGGLEASVAEVELMLEDGSTYGTAGIVQFSEVMVNESTGTVTLRARFANSQGELLPGMFVRARFAQGVDPDAILVPQAAVLRDPRGNARVFVVGTDNKIAERAVTATRTQGTNWVVTSGLARGDRVVVQGIAKVEPGALVKAVPADTPQRIGPRAPTSAAAGQR
jgi:membrane fusion protein, multidrug efflux system